MTGATGIVKAVCLSSPEVDLGMRKQQCGLKDENDLVKQETDDWRSVLRRIHHGVQTRREVKKPSVLPFS